MLFLQTLSKAFESLDNGLLIAKLNDYRFSLLALRLIHAYLSHRKQRTSVNNSYSNGLLYCFENCKAQFWAHFYSIFFLADLFVIHSDIDTANFTVDNTPCLPAKSVEDVIGFLERASVSLFRWFQTLVQK